MNLRDILYNEILPNVQKPSRYLGTEVNATHKKATDVDLRVALVFPDLYDLGLGNLGILILYSILNRLPWCWAERAYAPAPDMEAALRARRLPLFTNESKDPLDCMDLIGFTLQSELTYTNVLNILDLSSLPLRSKDRDDNHALIFAGGPSVFNPEPLAPFIDFFLIGDGEDAIVELADLMRGMRDKSRREKLKAVSVLPGFYVPELYPFETLSDGRILPKENAPKIVKRLVQDLDGATFPTDYIVPYTQQVHDRVSLEVLRGCTHGCRFCQAGMVTRPVRERSLSRIDELMERTLESTGYEEVSLVSLSTCDYSRVRTLVQQSVERAHKDNVAVSLPSLRLDSFSVDLADMVSGVRRSGLTFAPEAASPRLRAVINKWIPDEELLEMSLEAFRRGWEHVKCYFIIGLPTERDDDVQAIVDLCLRTLQRARTVNRKARVHTGVSTFVPKPFTPFQWAEQIGIEEVARRQGILERGFAGNRGVKFGRHHPETTFIEGLITRGDRRAGDLLEAAWQRGARFDTWDEYFNFDAWLKAIEEVKFDVPGAVRERDLDERLPWDHIDVMIPKKWFQDDWRRAVELKYAEDCRHGKCHLCGVIYRERELCKHMLKRSKAGSAEERDWQRKPLPPRVEPPPVQRLRFRIGRTGEARFLSHLELMNAWVRALRRARAPLSYSQGFHAHPKVNFSTASPVGEESSGDYMDILLKGRVEPAEFLARLQNTLPLGFDAFEISEVPMNAPSLMSSVTGFSYTLYARGDAEVVKTRIEGILASDTILVERKAKSQNGNGKGVNRINIRPLIQFLDVRVIDQGQLAIDFTTTLRDGKAAKPREIIALLGMDAATTVVVKCATFLGDSTSTPGERRVAARSA
ncbi:MAG: TIGR03960 family B12-binding radical SAM protein [Candidatus Hydrogenedentes bacterium]|nr:TIGR03960 family B12-binding radical SAM protein [Candidatus Hydrogenedentota bacterium]